MDQDNNTEDIVHVDNKIEKSIEHRIKKIRREKKRTEERIQEIKKTKDQLYAKKKQQKKLQYTTNGMGVKIRHLSDMVYSLEVGTQTTIKAQKQLEKTSKKRKKIDEELTDINITIVNLKRTLRNKEKNTKKLLRNTVRENTALPKVLANIVMQYVSPGT